MIDAYRDWIESALEYSGGTHDFEDVRAGIASGKMQLWPGANGCAVTEIIAYPRMKALHCFLYAGDLAQVLDMIADAVAWGKAQGCTSLTLAGRRGWERVLAPHGFKPVLTVMKLDF